MISFSLVLDNSLSNKMFLRHFLCLSAMFLRHFGASFLHHCGANSPIFDEWFMDCYSRFKSINNLTLIPVRSISYRGRIQTNQMVGIISLLYIIRNWASLRVIALSLCNLSVIDILIYIRILIILQLTALLTTESDNRISIDTKNVNASTASNNHMKCVFFFFLLTWWDLIYLMVEGDKVWRTASNNHMKYVFFFFLLT